MRGIAIGAVLFLALAATAGVVGWLLRDDSFVKIGSKSFIESVILAEMVEGVLTDAGIRAEHDHVEMQAQISWQAIRNGEIDLYVEYTGTLMKELLVEDHLETIDALRDQLATMGLRMTHPLGFRNNYGLGMLEQTAERLGIERVSDLVDHPQLRFRFSDPFMAREDCWPTLRKHYALPQHDARGMNHDLAYLALVDGACDLIDVYTTDAEIEHFGLRVLEDDLHHFPVYEPVVLYRADLVERFPGIEPALKRLEGCLDQQQMMQLNARVKYDKRQPGEVAADYLKHNLGIEVDVEIETWQQRLVRNTLEHLRLVAVSLTAAIIVALPLGVVAARRKRVGQVILATVGIVQTIPSLALLAFMVPLLGVGVRPAIMALFLYSLLPIVRNTHAGLHDIPSQVRDSASALGLPGAARLFRVELPMASRSIMAGIKTSAVINVGTAALGGLIAAGGFGQPIMTGLTRLDMQMIVWQGAVPASILALAVQGAFELAERMIVPRGLRLDQTR